MNSGTVIALAVVAVVIGAALFLTMRPAGSMPLLGGGEAAPPPQQAEGAQYISAVGGAIGSIGGVISSLYGQSQRQAGGTSVGGAK